MSSIARNFSSPNSWFDFSVPNPSLSAIQTFDLSYADGDHFVSRVGVGPTAQVLGRSSPAPTGNYGVVLGGKQRTSPTAGSLRLCDFSAFGGTNRAVRDLSLRGINGRSALPLPPEAIAVLNGFSMDFLPGNDHQIQRIGVLRDAATGTIRSSFGHATATIGYTGNFSYVVFPTWAFRHPPTVHRWRGSFRGSATAPLEKRSHELSLLVGFAFNFVNGVQNLRRIAINLAGDNLTVRYTGNSPGQPAEALIEYLNWSVPLS